MAVHGTARDEPVRATFAMLGDRWSTLILLVLAMGWWRHAELRRALSRLSAEQDISQRVLTQKLRAMERDGFVQRAVVPTVPPRVSYALTPPGAELAMRAQALIEWVNAHQDTIRAARERFDRSEED